MVIKRKNLLALSFVLLLLSLLLFIQYYLNMQISTDFGIFMVIFLSLVIFSVYFARLKNYPVPISILFLVVIGFILRSYYSYTLYSTIISPFPDSLEYISNLNSLLAIDKLDFETVKMTVGTAQFFYYYILYFTYNIFGSYYALYLVNILLFSFSMLFLYRIICKDFGNKIAYATTLVSIFSATFLIFTSNILKDSLVLFLVLLVFYVYKFGKKKHFLFLLFLIGCLTLTRIYAGFSVIAAIGFDIAMNRLRFKNLGIKVFSVITLAVLFFIVFNFTYLSKYLTLGQNFINDYSMVGAIKVIPSTLFNFLYAPYPWGIFSGEITPYSLIQIDSALAILFSFTLIMFLYKFLKYKELRTKMYLYLIPIFIHAVALGLAYGGGMRQRIGVFCFIILIFVVGLFYKLPQKDSQTP